MRIDSSATCSNPIRDARAAAGQQAQVVFSEVLKQVGRTGYASADAYQSPQAIETDIQRSWTNWFAAATQDGAYASGTGDVSNLDQRYGNILSRSWQEGGYHDPKQFLRHLSQDELNTVQQVFLLAAPIAVDSLSEEGALNLLIPPPAQVDANRDGLTQIGAGTTLRFPDSETPASVVAAWEDATAGMDSREKLTYVFRLKVPTFFPRPPADGSRNDGAVYPPGPPSIVDPTRQPKFSYGDLTQRALEALELFKYQTPPEQYASQKEFWTKFRDSLRAHGAS